MKNNNKKNQLKLAKALKQNIIFVVSPFFAIITIKKEDILLEEIGFFICEYSQNHFLELLK